MANETNTYEFVHEQEIKLNEEIRDIYYTKKDGYFVSDSLSSDKAHAKKLYELIVKHNGNLKTTTILETQQS